jgi:hypothetical protein
MTADPPARVAASLALLRPAADEVVVAVDSRVDPGGLHALAGVADRLVRYRFRPPVDRPRAWLMGQCRGDWILSIDGDEVPSPGLVEALPAMTRARDVVQHRLPRRWLFPDPGTWLAEPPWWPDFQVRLVRNDALLAPRSTLHAGPVPILPARHAETPLYHLDCLVRPVADRRDKAARYEAELPGRVAYGGGPLNDVLYLPEDWAPARRRPVPDKDRAWIDEVLAATASPPPGGAGGVDPPLVPDAEIDAMAPDLHPGDDDHRAHLARFDDDDRLAPGERRPVHVRVTNRGGAVWRWGLDQEPQVRVAHHWRTPDGELVQFEGERSPLPARLGPGDEAIVPVWVTAPAEPGRYLLEIDLVNEHVRWFEAPLVLEMTVGPRPDAGTGEVGGPC